MRQSPPLCSTHRDAGNAGRFPGRSRHFHVAAYVTALCITAFGAASAQTVGTISGTILDAETRTPLKSAAAVARDAADTNAKALGDLTDERGVFTIEGVPLDRSYTLEARLTGYEKQTVAMVSPTRRNGAVNVGEILLRPQPVRTDGVEVVAERDAVSVRADKTVYAIEGNPTYTATNVSELLGQIPLVTVDQEGKIALRGDDNVTIMVNDRPLMMPPDQRNKFLQSLSANMVKDVEIRTNPGAQFDAKNHGGIINIVTRRTMSDIFGGNVNAGADTRGSFNGNAGLYYNASDLNASLSGGGNYGRNEGTNTSTRVNFLDTTERSLVGNGSTISRSTSWNVLGQADYNVSANDLLSVSFNVNRWGSDYDSYGFHRMSTASGAPSGTFSDTSMQAPNSANAGTYSTASMLFRHTFGENHKLSLDVGYNGNAYEYGNIYLSAFRRADGTLDSLRSSGRTSISNQTNNSLITSLDYENPISETVQLTFGARNELNLLDDRTDAFLLDRSSGGYVPDSTQSNHYLPNNTIWAVYAQGVCALTDAISAQVGVRGERATVAAKYASGEEIIARTYTNFFPSGTVSYTLDEATTFALSYRRGVALPDVGALNPVVRKWNDLATSSGNPDLSPEFSHNVELNYTTFWGAGNMATVGPFYRATTGNIEQSTELINGATYSRSVNFNGTYSIGSSASLAMRPVPWLNLRLSGSAYSTVNRGSTIPGDAHSSTTGYSTNAVVGADLMEGLTLTGQAIINSPGKIGNNESVRSVVANFSLRARLLENKLTVTLRAADPFGLQKWGVNYTSPEFSSVAEGNWGTRFVGLNVSYNFGKIPRMEQHRQERTETKGSSGGAAGGQGGGQ